MPATAHSIPVRRLPAIAMARHPSAIRHGKQARNSSLRR